MLTHVSVHTSENAAGTGVDSKQNSCLEFAYTEVATFGNVTLLAQVALPLQILPHFGLLSAQRSDGHFHLCLH